MHRTISRNELSPETGGGPRCAQSASTSRTVTRGCQPASRVLRSAPALAGDCRGRPCGKPLRASQKAGPRSTGTRGRLREPLRCRGEPIQRTRERRVRRYRGDSEKACNLGGVHTRQLPGGIRTRWGTSALSRRTEESRPNQASSKRENRRSRSEGRRGTRGARRDAGTPHHG